MNKFLLFRKSWHLAVLAVLLLPGFILAQSSIGFVPQEIALAKQNRSTFELFDIVKGNVEDASKDYSEAVNGGVIFNLDSEVMSRINSEKPSKLKLQIPVGMNNSFAEVELLRFAAHASGVQVRTSDGEVITDANNGLHYRGIVSRDDHSLVAVSIFDNSISGFIATSSHSFFFGKTTDSESHILYEVNDLKETYEMQCGLVDDGQGYTSDQLTNSSRAAGDCIDIYVEAGQTVFNAFAGDMTNTLNFLNGVFAQSFVLYANDGLTLKISEIFVWTTADPYTGGDTGAQLNLFQNETSSINGDLGHLVEVQNIGGQAAGFSGICNANVDQSLCFSGFSGTSFNNVPTYSFNVFIISHEMGHLIGSRHTHACVWNGNNTAIDGCAGFVEGGCALPPSANPGTIMSYCTPNIDFAEGFHAQPAAVLQATLNNATCLNQCPSCTGNLPPAITCPADNHDLPSGCNPTVPTAATTWNLPTDNNPDPAIPTIAEGCVPFSLSSSDAISDNGCVRTITRTYTVTDGNGDTDECTQSFSFIMDNQSPTFDATPADVTLECSAVPSAPTLTASDNCMGVVSTIFINEIHYDNTGGDQGEFVEIAGTAGFDLSNCSLVLYNGSNNMVYNTVGLNGMIDDEGMGFGAVSFSFPANGLQNGAPDGVALVCDGDVMDFISYEGTMTAADGPAAGMTSVNIGTEPSNTPIGESMQLGGTGCTSATFTWSTMTMAESPGTLNAGQVFDLAQCPMGSSVNIAFNEVVTPDPSCPNTGTVERTWTATDACMNTSSFTQTITIVDSEGPELCNAPADLTLNCDDPIPTAEEVRAFDACTMPTGASVWINEIHYDNAGGDVNEMIEIAGIAGVDLSNYSIELYNGNGGAVYNTMALSGIIPSESCGHGAVAFNYPSNGIQNGAPDGIALIEGTTVLQFISYEGDFTAVGGTADGMMSTDIGVEETNSTLTDQSLQLTGTGLTGSDFTWSGPATSSPGMLNEGQELEGPILATLTEESMMGMCAGSVIITRTYVATDNCGNTTEHVQTITQDDATPPMAVCQDITVQLDEEGKAMIEADELDGGSSDNCTSTADLTFEASRTMFDCFDITPNTPMCANTHEVTLTVIDGCDAESMCIANVTVEDNIAPELTCPSNSIISLDAGECEYIYHFVPPFAVDNCEGILTTTFLPTTFTDNNGFAGNMFDIENTGIAPLTITMFDVHLESAAGTMNEVEVWYTTSAGTYVGNETNAGAWTSLGSSMVTSAGTGNPTALPVGGLTIMPGETYGIYIAQIDGGSDFRYTNGANNYNDANLSITTGVGKGNPAFTGGTFNPRTWNGNIHYSVVTGNMTEVMQTAGTDLNSGDSFVEGLYSWTYQADDGCGNVSECTFNLEVINYPVANTTTSLNCNAVINTSMTQDCEAVIGADMLLEGGPYRCYNDYIVTIQGLAGNVITEPGTYEVTVADPDSGVNCTTTINIEDKLPPVIACPDTLTMSCVLYESLKDGEIELEDPTISDCSDFNLVYADAVIGDDCGGREAKRTYIATDINGMQSSCVHVINITPLDFNLDIQQPAELVELGCGASDLSPEAIAAYFDDPLTKDNTKTNIIENHEGYTFAFPTYVVNDHVQKVDENICNLFVTYTDNVIDACGAGCHGNKKVIREWEYINWCTLEDSKFVQIIKASDNEAPTFNLRDTIVSTRPWDCTAEFMLPEPWELHDDCDIAPGYYVSGPAGVVISPKPEGGYIAVGAPKGKHLFFYTAYDCCGNERTDTAEIVVLDKVSPVVTTDQDIVVSLTPNYPNGGQAKLFTHHIDNGSFDVCTDVHMEIRRADDAPQCGNDGDLQGNQPYNNNRTFNDTNIRFGTGNHPNDNRFDTDHGEFVKFCCEDIEAEVVDANGDGVIDSLDRGYVMVIIRVWDDANMSGVYGDEVEPFPGCAPQRDNYNEGWAYVKVEDKLPPVISCPADATIYCDWGIDVSADFGGGFQNTDQANFDKTGVAEAYGTCGSVDVYFNDNINVDDCGVGTIIRQFQASTNSKTGTKTVTCQQVITVLPRPSQFSVSPPNPNPLSVGCSLTQEDLDKRLPTVTGGPCDVIGENVKVDTFLFENGVCKKWVAEYNYMNWCTGESMGPFYAYFVYEDTEKPVLDDCEDKMFGVDANCEAVLTLTNSATDGGGCTDEGWLKWQLFVDTWADGNINHYASSFVSPSGFRNWKPVAGDDPMLPGGHTYADVVYVKYIEPTSSMGNDEVSVTLDAEIITGKMSNHKVHWKVTDGCHNHSTCSYDVMVADKKAPTPYCVSLSSALMENGGVELWASDFDKGSFDNCCAQEELLFTFYEERGAFLDTIIRVGNTDYLVNASTPQYFDENGFVDFDGDGVTYPKAKTGTINKYDNGDIQKWVPAYRSSAKVFDCDEFGAQGPNGVPVRMSVWDTKMNTDFCVVYLSLIDNQGGCDPNSRGSISGRIATENGNLIHDVEVTIVSPFIGFSETKVVDGEFEFKNLVKDVDYNIVAKKEGDYMNGISTLDLILIQRHILGLSELSSEMKLIAADVNSDMNIRSSDLVELRKLILGVKNDFTAPSWMIIKEDQQLSMNTPLVYEMDNNTGALVDAMYDINFIGTKVGDVSGDAAANLRSTAVDSRSNKTVNLVVEEQEVVAGQTVAVDVTSANFADVYGYQFTTNLNGLNYNGVRSGAITMLDENVGIISNEVITTSWASTEMASVNADQVLFTLEFVATKSGKLSSMLNINSNVTKAEAYTDAEMNVANIDVTFRTNNTEVAVNALYQNEPNPFSDVTTVAYELANAGDVTFTLYDVTGKVVLVKDVEGVKGINTVTFTTADMKVRGIVYYQIESGDFTATKKMLILEK